MNNENIRNENRDSIEEIYVAMLNELSASLRKYGMENNPAFFFATAAVIDVSEMVEVE